MTGIAAGTTGRHTSIATSVLGGMSMLTASYLAKARGSGEPEFSTTRVKNLENFVREAEAWILDNGHRVSAGEKDGVELDRAVTRFRRGLEDIVGVESVGVSQFIREKVPPV